jgi:hypothetical protein
MALCVEMAQYSGSSVHIVGCSVDCSVCATSSEGLVCDSVNVGMGMGRVGLR